MSDTDPTPAPGPRDPAPLDDPRYDLLDALLALDTNDPEACEHLRLACCQRCAQMAAAGMDEGAQLLACRETELCGLRDPDLLFMAQQWVATCRETFAHPELATAQDYEQLAQAVVTGRSFGITVAPNTFGWLDLAFVAPTLRAVLMMDTVMEIAGRAGCVWFGNVRAFSGHKIKDLQEAARAQVDTRLDHQAATFQGQIPLAELARRQGRSVSTVSKGANLAAAGVMRKRRKPRGRRS